MTVLGRCKGCSERCWPLVCRWVCAAAKKRNEKGKRSWKINILIKIAQNSKGTVCTGPLRLRLYLPLLPVSAWPPPLSYLLFDHFPFFLQTLLLLWLHTRTVPPYVFSSFFLPFLHSLGITSTLINITALNIPFPFLVTSLLFHHLPLPYLLCASVFVPAGLTSLSSYTKHTPWTVVTAIQGQWIASCVAL